MPTTAIATYTGAVLAEIDGGPNGIRLNDGTSTVTVDFSGKTVDVTMTGFTAKDYITGAAITSPIDTIEISDMVISGNTFSGGTLTTTNGGDIVDIVGDNSVLGAGGNFFGYDNTTSRPAEVGGAFSQKGDDGYVTGAFIAK